MYLLDTNILFELRKGRSQHHRLDPALAAFVDSVAPVDLYVSVITIFEIEYGIRLAEHGKDAPKAASLRRWLDSQVIEQFGQRILPVSLDIARRAAALHVPDPRPERDSLIAATALVHRLKVVTRNVQHFEPMKVELVRFHGQTAQH